MACAHTVGGVRYSFDSLAQLLSRATPARSGDQLAGICAASAQERVAAQMALADLPLKRFLSEAVVPYETDDVTRLILDTHERAAFAPIASLTVGDLRSRTMRAASVSPRLRRV
jgi:ethanolamine ammonia-lyase large subunit